MKRVKQTKFGPVEGNCFAACIASLLEVPIEEVTIDTDPNSDKWFDTLQAYLRPKNLFFLEVRIDVAKNYPFYEMNGIYCVFSGKSPREFEGKEMNHAVVGMINAEKDRPVIFDCIHDPHPDNTFIKDGTLWGLGFLMALDPSKPTNPKGDKIVAELNRMAGADDLPDKEVLGVRSIS